MAEEADGLGRVAQRRRTRNAIVAATASLLAAGGQPSLGDIAAAADVSRRTIYMYFPTLDQLLLDATVGAIDEDVEAAMAAAGGDDVRARVAAMITVLAESLARTLPMGRTIIKLTVDAAMPDDGPKRGFRRVRWIEQAVEPIRAQLGRRRHDQLVSSLACVVGWESFIVLQDVRGLDAKQAGKLVVAMASALIDAALAEAGPTGSRARPAGRPASGGRSRT